MTKDEALKLALEALEAGDWFIGQLEMIVYSSDDTGTHENRAQVQAAITVIKEALAQPAQEPVAWADMKVTDRDVGLSWAAGVFPHATPLHHPTTAGARNFCPRCGKRTADLTVIHTCTPPEGGHQ